jgi:hypothetical protein
MNPFFPSLLAVLGALSNQVPKVRLWCDWMTGPCVFTGSMSSSIFIRLPLLHYLIDYSFYSSLTLLDAEGTLHAELHVKLSQPMVPPAPALSPDNSDVWSQGSSVPATHTTYTSSSSSEMARSPIRGSKTKQTVEVKQKPVYTSLRKGGRLR